MPSSRCRRTIGVCACFGVAAFVAAFLMLTSRTARAAGTTSALSWVRLAGAESCIPVSELSTRVEKRLGRAALVSPSVAAVAIEGHVEVKASPRGFHAVLRGTRRDGSEIGVRELDTRGEDCRRMDDDLVLVIALLIDPDAVGGARPEPTPVPSPPPEPTTPWRSPPSIDTQLGVRGAFGLFPDTAAGFTLGARVGLGHFAFGLGLFSTLESEQDNPGPIQYSVTDGELSVRGRWSLSRRVEVAGEAGARFGVMSVQAPASATSHSLPLADVALGPRFLVFVAGPMFVEASGSVVVPLFRQQPQSQIGADTPAAIATRPAVGGDLGLSVGLRFAP
jgi:hypothetical protein